MKFINLDRQYELIKQSVDENIKAVHSHGHYILGPEVAELEVKLADRAGVTHCIATSNGTDGLLVALMALGIGPGDEVIVPGFTFIAPVEAVCLLGAKPVFIDVEVGGCNIDVSKLEKGFSRNTKAIIAVSLYGACAEFDEINALAKKYGVPVIEDAAQSFGATYKNSKSCGLTDIAVTSFFPSKPLGCYGDGGAIFTNNDELAHIIRQITVHGQETRYCHTRLGVNARLDTIQAAILLAKLDVFDQEIEKRHELAMRYNELLDTCGAIELPQVPPHCKSVYAQFTVKLADRDRVADRMKASGAPTAVHYPLPAYKQPAYRQEGLSFPVSEMLAERVMSIPICPYMTSQEQLFVCETLVDAIKGS
nr:DegT/DnrJ/EryC1/StrS family aminotransferase [Hahella sp. KA22]